MAKLIIYLWRQYSLVMLTYSDFCFINTAATIRAFLEPILMYFCIFKKVTTSKRGHNINVFKIGVILKNYAFYRSTDSENIS